MNVLSTPMDSGLPHTESTGPTEVFLSVRRGFVSGKNRGIIKAATGSFNLIRKFPGLFRDQPLSTPLNLPMPMIIGTGTGTGIGAVICVPKNYLCQVQ